MSYILEALRKADAERERDRNTVPDLHAQLIPLTARATIGDADDDGAGAWLFLGGAALAVLLLAGLGWWWFAGSEPPRQIAAIPAATLQTPAAQAASAAGPANASAASGAVGGAASAPTPGPDEAAAAEPPAKSAATSTAKTTSKPKAAPVAKATPKPAPEPAPRSSRAARAAAAPAKPVAPVVPAVPKAAEPAAPPARVPALAELPDALRREVPTMAIGGSVYSPEAARRMVVINGQVFVEGSQLAPQLKLERIEQKSAVFSIRGERFAMPL